MVAKGSLIVSTMMANTVLQQGERLSLQPHQPAMLVNATTDDVDVVLILMITAETAPEPELEGRSDHDYPSVLYA